MASQTIMGDEIEAFINPNIGIDNNNLNESNCDIDKGTTLMGFINDNESLNVNNNNNDVLNNCDVLNDCDDRLQVRQSGITLMGDCNPLKFRRFDNDEQVLNNNITLMGHCDSDNMIFSNNQSITLMGDTHTRSKDDINGKHKKIKKKKISSESYWRMFVFQFPQLFTQILSYLLPYQKLQVSNVTKFMNQFIMQCQLKYMIDRNGYIDDNEDDEKLDQIKTSGKIRRNWQKYDVIDYKMDFTIWKKHFSKLINSTNYKSLIINIDNNNNWSSNIMKQLKYYFMNQTKLITIYDCMEMRNFEDNMYKFNNNNNNNNNDYDYDSPFSQTLDNIIELYCNNNDDNFGINGTIFCCDLLSSPFCKIQSLYLQNNKLNNKCINILCKQLLLSSNKATIYNVINLDLSENINITSDCIQILFTLIGEKCNSLKYLNLSATSIDNSVCNVIYDYYRCYYGSNSCKLNDIHLMNNNYITIQGLQKLNKIFIDKNKHDIIIKNEKDFKKFNLINCVYLQNINRDRFDLDFRILISSQCQQQYDDKVVAI